MRPTYSLAVLAAAGAACSGSATEPSRVVASAAPSGIPVAATLEPATRLDADPLDATVTAVGDSVVLTYVFGGGTCGLDFTASAGIFDGALVVTHVGQFPGAPVYCSMDLPRVGPTFRFAVRPPARGRLAVVLRQRLPRRAGAPEFTERDVARQTVTLP